MSLTPISRRDLDSEVSLGQAKQGWKNKDVNREKIAESKLGERDTEPSIATNDGDKSDDAEETEDVSNCKTPSPTVEDEIPKPKLSHKAKIRPKPKHADVEPPMTRVMNALSSWLTLDSLWLLAEGEPSQLEALKHRLKALECPQEIMASLVMRDNCTASMLVH